MMRDRLAEIIAKLEFQGFNNYAEMLSDALLYSLSSSEMHFKISGIIKLILLDLNFRDDVLRKILQEIKIEVDEKIN